MGRFFTCISRDATDFLKSVADGSVEYPLRIEKEGRIAGFELCKELLANNELLAASQDRPMMASKEFVSVGFGGENWRQVTGFWIFKNRIFNEHHDEDFSPEERALLIQEEFDRERQQFEKLKVKFSGLNGSHQSRTKIPSNVRVIVWQRDGGKCVECGSNENLEYDHIIPFSKGGSSTERNLQLLCANCNRLKSDRIQ